MYRPILKQIRNYGLIDRPLTQSGIHINNSILILEVKLALIINLLK